MTIRTVSAIAHAKAILLGEHAAVYGYPALAVPVTAMTLTATVETFGPDGGPSMLNTDRYHGPLDQAPKEYGGLAFLASLMARDAVKLSYRGSIPQGRGLGSSAASAWATAQALNQAEDLDWPLERLVEASDRAEDIVHGEASGVDLAAVRSNRLVVYRRTKGFSTMGNRLGAWLVIADTGQAGSTKTAVASVRRQIETSEPKKTAMDRLGAIATQGIEAWRRRDAARLGTLFDQAQDILAGFGLSTAEIDQLIRLARQAGAQGAKLSGSGLGGAIIALAKDREQAESVGQALQTAASGVWTQEI